MLVFETGFVFLTTRGALIVDVDETGAASSSESSNLVSLKLATSALGMSLEEESGVSASKIRHSHFLRKCQFRVSLAAGLNGPLITGSILAPITDLNRNKGSPSRSRSI